jgi:hypothetical protein
MRVVFCPVILELGAVQRAVFLGRRAFVPIRKKTGGKPQFLVPLCTDVTR